jgi:integrase
MLSKRPLTDRGIASLKPAKGAAYHLSWDALVPGLAVRVTATGAKSFVVVGRFAGSSNPTARSLGKVGAITLVDARDKAREWHKLITAGVDPAQARLGLETVRAVCEDYQTREGDKLRSARWRRGALERLVYPTLGHRPVMELRRADMVRLHDKLSAENGPVIANRIVELLRRIFNWYSIRNEDFHSPIVRGMTTAEASRDRVLTDAELRAIWRTNADLTLSAYISFLLLTAARRAEAAEMKWSEVADDGTWTLPASRNKTGVELVRPLSAAAQAIVSEQPRKGEFIFSRTGGAPLGGLSRSKAALDQASGTSGWTLHDLRRTARSLMSRAGVPNDHAERCLGHVIGGVRGVYDRHEYLEEKRRAFEALARMIEGIVEAQT